MFKTNFFWAQQNLGTFVLLHFCSGAFNLRAGNQNTEH